MHLDSHRTSPALTGWDLEQVARSLEGGHPEAAAALREGLDESLTLHKLGRGRASGKPRAGSQAIVPPTQP